LVFLLAAQQPASAQVYPGLPPPPAAPGAIGGCLGTLIALEAAMKAKCCASPLGKMLGGAMAPISCLTGGVICNPCDACNPAPTAAAAIKKDQAAMKARRAMIRFLGTVDCHYYPEAQKALLSALRCDRSPCVRWEAAHSLANGCCCSQATIEALTICITASEKDGNPSENCLAVRVEAYRALQVCLSCKVQPGGPAEQSRPEMPNTLPPGSEAVQQAVGVTAAAAAATAAPVVAAAPVAAPEIVLTAYYQAMGSKPLADSLEEARAVAHSHRSLPERLSRDQPMSGERGLTQLWKRSATPAVSRGPQPTLARSAQY
jgi:hypothetical protein